MNPRSATIMKLCLLYLWACSGSSGDAATGMTSQLLSIGSPCTKDSQCGAGLFICMTDHPGGYCSRHCDITKADADCPSEAICQFDGMVGECHRKCLADTDCRSGYMCSPASSDPMNRASHAYCDMARTPVDGGHAD